MDEPFGALDAQTRDEMQRLLHDLHRSHPCLIMFVTHDVTEALALGDRVVVLSTRPARVAADLLIAEPRPRSVNLASVDRGAAARGAGVGGFA
jgi:ABC-type nitrate/sulfonate/bicarbonate transport system ATPase subunit